MDESQYEIVESLSSTLAALLVAEWEARHQRMMTSLGQLPAKMKRQFRAVRITLNGPKRPHNYCRSALLGYNGTQIMVAAGHTCLLNK